MELPLYQIDAFAHRIFAGNPAAVVPLDGWLEDDVLQAIARENNLSETAFFVARPGKGDGHYHLRWFTPTDEVNLCGHATLASAYCLFTDLKPDLKTVHFKTKGGELQVTRGESDRLDMDFPALALEEIPERDAQTIAGNLERVLGRRPVQMLRSANLMAVYESEADLRGLRYSAALGEVLMEADSWGLVVTAPPRKPRSDGGEFDFLSRFFAPLKGIAEDPVTGSAHCMLAPYWSERLDLTEMVAFQASVRGGTVYCYYDHKANPGRVKLSGRCVPYLKGRITIA